MHPDRGDVAALISRRVEAFEEFHGVEARLGLNAARSQIPVFFGVLSVFWICNSEATRKQMTERADFSCSAARGWLPSEARGRVARLSEVA